MNGFDWLHEVRLFIFVPEFEGIVFIFDFTGFPGPKVETR